MIAFYKRIYIILIFALIGIAGICTSSAQIVINEVQGVNIGNILDEDGQANTWLELYNSGNTAVDLKNYSLTDRYNKTNKWTLPSYVLSPGKHLLVFTSGKDRKLFIDRWETPIWYNNSWKYLAPKAAVPSNWTTPGFNDLNWTSGRGGIGYGDGDDSTTIAASNMSVFMRQKFDVPDTGKIIRMLLTMDYDDGFIAYLNGVEIARSNMNGKAWNDSATTSHEALIYQGLAPETYNISDSVFRNLLMPTGNVLAVQVHNVLPSSSDLSAIPFLSLAISADTGKWYTKRNLSWIPAVTKSYLHTNFKLGRNESIYFIDNNGILLDSQNTGYLDSGLVMARISDGQSWCITPTPTPDSTNNGQQCFKGYAAPPAFNLKAGFYKNTQFLKLSTSNANFVIRYTENGNIPDMNSKKFNNSITIDKSKVIRARCFDTKGQYLPGKVYTNTYFINENITLPVISITTDSANLWDWDTGMYVLGPNATAGMPNFGANFWYDWEKPCHVEYFKPSKIGTQLFELDAGLQIHGGWSRSYAQRSFRIESRNGYDSSLINYPLWDLRQYKTVKNFNIRNAGIDWLTAHMRDDVMQRNVYNTHIDMMAGQPCVAFVNGAYWGVYHIREKEDEDYLANTHGIDPNKVDIVKWDNTVLKGDGNEWAKLYNYISGSDFTQNSNYDSVTKMLDIENYCDYFITETYYINNDWLGDWTNNIKFWRPRIPTGKWRYILWDTDFGIGLASAANQDKIYGLRFPASWNMHTVMFDTLITNTQFKNYFVNRYADLINTVFQPVEFKKVIQHYVDTMDNEMTREYNRWWPAQSNLVYWNSNINVMKNFIDARPAFARNYIQSNFNLVNQDTLTLNVSPVNAGRIKISTIIPTKYPWNGVYFNGVPVTITAIPNPGYTFNYFTIGNTKDSNQSITQNFTGDTIIKAFFKGGAQSLKLAVSEINYNSPKSPDAGNWIELHNYGNYKLDISDWRFHTHGDYYNYKIPTGTTIPAGGYLVLCEDTDRFNSVYKNIYNKIGNLGFSLDNFGDSVYLFDNIGKTAIKLGFSDTIGWPQLADGLGHTMEHKYDSAVYTYNTWFNGCIGGSPGKAFAPCKDDIVISEINYKSSSNADAGDWVELYNTTNTAINISKWDFKDGVDTDKYIIPIGSIIPAKGYLVLVSDTVKFKKEFSSVSNYIGQFSFGLSSSGELLRLYDSVGNLKFNVLYSHHQPEWPYKPNGLGYTLESKDSIVDYSTADSWTTGCLGGSPGTARVSCNYSLTVSEINYNMEASLDHGDYLELYNYGKQDLYIGGWKLKTKSGIFEFPVSAKIKNKDRLLVTNTDSNFMAWNHNVFTNFKLDNFADSIILVDENGKQILLTYYDTSSGFTPLANGIGFTLELVSKSSSLTNPASWFAGCLGGSPGVAYAPCNADVVVSELNYQSVGEMNLGDWMELYNPNLSQIDLSGWYIQTNGSTKQLNNIVLQAHERVVLVGDSAKFNKYFSGISNIIYAPFFNLDNTSEKIQLFDSKTVLKLYLTYNNSTSWDNLPSGHGYTLNLDKNIYTHNGILNASAWKHECLLGSPGDSGSNCVSQISVSEICLRSDSLLNSGNWIELHNYGSGAVNLLNYKISSNNQNYIFNENVFMNSGERLVLAADSQRFANAYHISASHTTLDSLPFLGQLNIYNESGKSMYQTNYNSANKFTQGYGNTLESLADTGVTTTNWFVGCPGGSPNNIYSPCKINPLISEISTIPDAKFDDGKWIEIWNRDTAQSLDISNWSVGTNDYSSRYIFPKNTLLNPKSRLVLNKDDIKFKAVHPFTNQTLLYNNLDIDTTGVIRIWDENNKPQFVLLYNNIYQNPAYTLELNLPDTNLEGLSSSAAWQEGCYTGSPASSYVPCVSPVWVSEINYHSLPSKDAGDWFELYNPSLKTIDLTSWNIVNEAKQNIKLNALNLLPDSFQAIVSDNAKFTTQFPTVYNKYSASFSLNNTDKLRFYDTEGRLRFIQTWGNKTPWNDSADGLGYTLELMPAATDPSQPNQWTIGCLGGSPGTAHVACLSNINITNTYNTSFKIFPNPAKDYIIIETANNLSNKYILLDATGRILLQGNAQGIYKIDLGNYAKGIYFISINNEVVRVVKE